MYLRILLRDEASLCLVAEGVTAEQREQCPLRVSHLPQLAADGEELDPRGDLLLLTQHQGADLQYPLPVLNVPLATLGEERGRERELRCQTASTLVFSTIAVKTKTFYTTHLTHNLYRLNNMETYLYVCCNCMSAVPRDQLHKRVT